MFCVHVSFDLEFVSAAFGKFAGALGKINYTTLFYFIFFTDIINSLFFLNYFWSQIHNYDNKLCQNTVESKKSRKVWFYDKYVTKIN